jgi:hypothetical protein
MKRIVKKHKIRKIRRSSDGSLIKYKKPYEHLVAADFDKDGIPYCSTRIPKGQYGLMNDLYLDDFGKIRKRKKNSPRLTVFVKTKEISISISENPEILRGGSKALSRLPEAELKNIMEFIKENRMILTKYWEMCLCTSHLLNYLEKKYTGRKLP